MRSEEQITEAIYKYGDTIKRICFTHLKNRHDTQDIFQNVFLKYALFPGVFQSPQHEKNWLIRVAINECRDWLKALLRKSCSIDDNYEKFTAVEIAEILGKNENTIYTWLSRAKKILKEQLGGEDFE